MFAEYLDVYGFLHNIKNPKPDSSENPLTFTGTHFLLKDQEPGDWERLAMLNAKVCKDGLYRPTPVTEWGVNISHDDATMWFSALRRYGMNEEIRAFKAVFPNHYQPWNILYYWALQEDDFKIPCLTKYMGKVSCKQGYKTRGGNTIAKTDGKILALGRALAAKDEKYLNDLLKIIRTKVFVGPLPLNNKLVPHILVEGKEDVYQWRWGTCWDIFMDYYNMDSQHPNVIESRKLG